MGRGSYRVYWMLERGYLTLVPMSRLEDPTPKTHDPRSVDNELQNMIGDQNRQKKHGICGSQT